MEAILDLAAMLDLRKWVKSSISRLDGFSQIEVVKPLRKRKDD